MGLSSGHSVFVTQIDTYTSLGTGAIVDISTIPLSQFTISVSSTGTVTSWAVVLEGSIDGINFSTIAMHTNLIGNNISIFPGVIVAPCLYFRTQCTALVLGLGTNIIVRVLGVQ